MGFSRESSERSSRGARCSLTEAAWRLTSVGAVAMGELSFDDCIVLTSQPNVLIEGPEAATEAVLRALRPHCREPMSDWGDALGEQRPPTLIVRDVAALTATDQQH